MTTGKNILFVKVSVNIIDFVAPSKGYVDCYSAFDKDLEVTRHFKWETVRQRYCFVSVSASRHKFTEMCLSIWDTNTACKES